MTEARAPTRIQQKNRAAILGAALDVFSSQGFRGATVDEIATAAGLSKPNLLYYFPSKEAIHAALLEQLLDTWLDPLRALDPTGEPLEEILAYMRRKLQMARDMPRESRLFANEIVQGAPRIHAVLSTDLKALVDEKAAVIAAWSDAGRIARCIPITCLLDLVADPALCRFRRAGACGPGAGGSLCRRAGVHGNALPALAHAPRTGLNGAPRRPAPPSLCRLCGRVVGMGGPVGVFALDHLAGARVHLARGHRHHRDAILDRADIDAEVAGDAIRHR